MPLPVLGAHTFGFVGHADPAAAIAQIAGLGLKAVQLMAAPPHYDPWISDDPRDDAIRAALAAHALPLLALDLASSDINLASAAPAVVAFAENAYIRLLHRAKALGAPHICIGSGRRHALMAASGLPETFRAAFRRIRAEGERLGVGLLLENHPQGLLASAEAMCAFLDAEGDQDTRIIYDVANAFSIDEDPATGLTALGDRLAIVHLSDSPKGGWRHDPIGSGDIPFPRIACALQDTGFSGPLVLEILSPSPLADLERGREALRAAGFLFA